MSPEFYKQWEKLLEGIEMRKIPVQFIKKLILKIDGKKQHTINIEKLIKQGLEPDDVEEVVGRTLYDLQGRITRMDYILNVESIADTVQPETEKLLNNI